MSKTVLGFLSALALFGSIALLGDHLLDIEDRVESIEARPSCRCVGHFHDIREEESPLDLPEPKAEKAWRVR